MGAVGFLMAAATVAAGTGAAGADFPVFGSLSGTLQQDVGGTAWAGGGLSQPRLRVAMMNTKNSPTEVAK